MATKAMEQVLIPLTQVLEVIGDLCPDCQTKIRVAFASGKGGPVTLQQIVWQACAESHTSPEYLLHGGNHRELVEVRTKIAHRAHRAGFSMQRIGQALNRHHTSILHLLKTRKA